MPQVSLLEKAKDKRKTINQEPERLVGTKWKPNFTPVPFFRGAGGGKDLPREINRRFNAKHYFTG